jgi:hypothetical protein
MRFDMIDDRGGTDAPMLEQRRRSSLSWYFACRRQRCNERHERLGMVSAGLAARMADLLV